MINKTLLKFAFVKWLNTGIVISGLSWILYSVTAMLATEVFEEMTDAQRFIDAAHTDIFLGWFVLVALTFGIQLYGEKRHANAMAAKQQSAQPEHHQ